MNSKKIMVEDSEADNFMEILEKFINSDEVKEVEKLIIGNWGEAWDMSPNECVDKLCENAEKFENLEEIHFADMDGEECEMSWIQVCDMGKLIMAFPKLKSFKVNGGEGLAFENLEHKNLEELVLINGGLFEDTIEDLKNIKLPNLKHLEIYLGCEDYGFDSEVEDLKAFVSKELFPNLKYLGLKNCDKQDEIAKLMLEAENLKKIESLDLSMGTMTDKGADFLLQNDKLKALKSVDVSDNYISKEKIKEMEESEINFILGEQEEGDDWGDGDLRYYTSINE